MKDFTPKQVAEPSPPAGISQRMQSARQAHGITRYELGRLSNVPATVVRAVEQAVAQALGLTIEVVQPD